MVYWKKTLMVLSADLIESEYHKLGYKLGWRFLTSPERNIDTASVALITINPGGNVFEPARYSVEDGSAYVIESWKDCPPGQQALQRQVQQMFEIMNIDPKDVLSGYLVPFRSRNWADLPRKSEALKFGAGLWREVFAPRRVKTVIAFGKDTAPYVSDILGARFSRKISAGWGDQTIDEYSFGIDGRMLVLPHLSRYALFGREPSESAFRAALKDADTSEKESDQSDGPGGGITTAISKAALSAKAITEKAISEAINWAYDRIIEEDIGGFSGAEHLANEYRAQSHNSEDAIDSLIKWQAMQAGTAGFVTGLGGIFTLPVAVPANLVSVIYLQLRMIATIAHLRGYDIKSDQVRGFVIACLAGSSISDIFKDIGVQVGTKLTQKAIQQISGATLLKINRAVGIKIVTKAGTTGVVNLAKVVPFVGGAVSGAFDATTTYAIGSAAKALFVNIAQQEER
jgi:uncharacterized protein (DUF697 family)